jgi:oligosaccharide repeat unit polymerase
MMAPSGGALLLSVGLMAWAGVMRALTGTWLHPGAFFSLFWCFAGILPLVFAPQEIVGANAILWLILASVAVSLGAVVGNFGFKTRVSRARSVPTDREIALFGWALAGSVLLGMGSSVFFATGSGIPLSSFLHLQQLVVTANQIYFSRYAQGGPVASPRLSQALLPFVYLAPAIGGVLFVLRREWGWKLFALLAFVPAIAVTVMQTTKAAFLFALVLWLSGYFATRLRLGQLGVFTLRHVAVTAGAGAVMIVFFFAVTLARLASTDLSFADVVLLKLVTAAFGHMTVFSQWLADYWAAPFSPSLGRVTFAGPLEMLGFGERIPGLFDSVVELVAGERSNIYTGFRPLIQDFGIPGALAVLSLLGVIGGVGFRLVAGGRWSAVPLLLIAYVTIFWTPVTWFWIYNSLTATVVALGLLVWIIRFWRGAGRARLGEAGVGTA